MKEKLINNSDRTVIRMFGRYTAASQGWYTTLNNLDAKLFYIEQVLGFVYTILCLGWFFYIIIDIFTHLRIKRRLVTMIEYDPNPDHVINIFIRREEIIRKVIFLMFLMFELLYYLHVNVYGFLYLSGESLPIINISIGSNCSLDSNSIIGRSYDSRVGNVICVVIYLLFGYYSFSMIIWLFGASLLHLSFAAINQLRVEAVFLFILLGMVINMVFIIPITIPYISIFAKITQSFIDQVSFFVVLYIANKKFFPAMSSRVIDAYHPHKNDVYRQQKRLLKQYKVLILVFLFTFEVYILKNIIFYNLSILFQSFSINSCWFPVTFHLPVSIFTLSESTQDILAQASYYIVVVVQILDILVCLSLIIVNLNFVYVIFKKYFKNKFVMKIVYRYQVLSAPLLSDPN